MSENPGVPEATNRRAVIIAALAIVAIALHLVLWAILPVTAELSGIAVRHVPLLAALFLGGGPLVFVLFRKLLHAEFGSDLLAGISIVTSILLGEYLAGTLVVLMLSGGEALEAYAVRSASSVLQALAKRMPSQAHRRVGDRIDDVALDKIEIGDALVVFPHEVCPVDGTVIEGRGVMDESYLTGEPYRISKAPGANVLSGAVNGESALTIRADRHAADSRYAKIMEVMRASEQRRPRLRRLGDQLGAWYTPLAVLIALGAWTISGEAIRFLAVLVVATPCPLLIAIPVAIIGSISLSARRGIIIKDPAILEKIGTCRTAIFDKTGTLTYGRPELTELTTIAGIESRNILALVSSLERYSKHPLAGAILEAARKATIEPVDATEVSELPGAGLRGFVQGRNVRVTSRHQWLAESPADVEILPSPTGGLECVVIIDGRYAATLRFRDEPRADGAPFIEHLGDSHGINRVLLVSGDRELEVRHLADRVGIRDVYAGQTPEQKIEIVRRETAAANTIFVGDGINDAPALTAATVGLAFGSASDITAEAAGAVLLDPSLRTVDELLHIGKRLRTIALQSAVGGMMLSLAGMAAAASGYLPPVAGAILQELIDVAAVVNALRTALPPRTLTDFAEIDISI